MALRMLEDSTVKSLYNTLSESNLYEEENFEDVVKRDFKLFLLDKYNDENYENVSEEDVNEYFTGMFYDIQDYDGLEDANNAEAIIRKEYNLEDKFEEVSFDEIITRMSNAISYEELYDAVSLVEDPSIRNRAEEMLQTCERDGDDVETAYSITTSDCLDMYANDENVFRESVNLKEDINKITDENYDEAVKYINAIESSIRAYEGDRKYHGGYTVHEYKFQKQELKRMQKLMKEYKKTINESINLNEDEKVIWKSEVEADDYDKDELKNNDYKDYIDNFDGTHKPISYEEFLESDWLYNFLYNEFEMQDEGTEWYDFVNSYPEDQLKAYYQEYIEDTENLEPDKPKEFDDWFEDYVSSDEGMSQAYAEDLDDNVLPMIDNQVNGPIFVTGSYNSNYPEFSKSGPGGKIFTDIKDFRNWLAGFDYVYITDNDGQVGVKVADHDGSIFGSLYTLPNDDAKVLEIAKSLSGGYDTEEYTDDEIIEEFKYDLSAGNIDMRDIKKPELLMPIKNGFMTNESLTEGKEIISEKDYKKLLRLFFYGFSEEDISEMDATSEVSGFFSGITHDDLSDPEFPEFNFIRKYKLTKKQYNTLYNKLYKDVSSRIEQAKAKINKDTLTEAKKSKKKKDKKPEERIIMQQGNVTCLKQGDKYKVFEEAEDENLKEYSNQEEAMKDALTRCGVDPDNELTESIETKAYNMLKENKNYEDFYKELKNEFDDDKLIPVWNEAIKKLSE